MSPRLLGLQTRACIAGIGIGIICMIQPFVFELFKWGFLLLLAATLLYIVVSHLPERSTAAANTDVTEAVPIALSAPGDSNS
jgi:hypothetical protein